MSETYGARLPSPRELKDLIEAERRHVPFAHWRDGAGEQHIITLSEGRERATIGRRDLSDIALTWDSKVSRTHALLEPVGDEWTLVDDGLSRNGSYLNGTRIHGRQRLHDGDSMCFGDTHVYFRQPGRERGSESTARAPGSAGEVPLTETLRKVLVALSRPVYESRTTIPATNPQIAAELHLSVDAVKQHLRTPFDRFELGDLPQNEKRGRLVSVVLSSGVLVPHDF